MAEEAAATETPAAEPAAMETESTEVVAAEATPEDAAAGGLEVAGTDLNAVGDGSANLLAGSLLETSGADLSAPKAALVDHDERLDVFFLNNPDLTESAMVELRACSRAIQEAVIGRGDIKDARNPSGALIARIRDARQWVADALEPEQLDQFIEENELDEAAITALKSQPGWVQQAVCSRGKLIDVTNTSSALMSRIRDAKRKGPPLGVGAWSPWETDNMMMSLLYMKGFGKCPGKSVTGFWGPMGPPPTPWELMGLSTGKDGGGNGKGKGYGGGGYGGGKGKGGGGWGGGW
eukprot:TRINITY_DN9085_c0_g1_i1.p1 TRINITY_DN9085_c0_g1~~TRINITY_DN9085_c0_g1_i1.p1  ORF type:complete len:316 (-),score=73.33 TRINITY_DN9085_c0_g1_i1:153-1031(-)